MYSGSRSNLFHRLRSLICGRKRVDLALDHDGIQNNPSWPIAINAPHFIHPPQPAGSRICEDRASDIRECPG
jgi:hypothetical protein